LAQGLVSAEAWEEAITVCQGILSRDDCWEQAYRLMMTAYARQGHRSQALRTYHRCVERLQSQLGVSPLPATTAAYQALLGERPVTD
jgi:DNA-binding SARP family transcriptional activator